MGGRNKSKKFLKQKQGNQKKRSKFQVKSAEQIANSKSDMSTRSDVESISDASNSMIDLNQYQFDSIDNNNDLTDTISIASDLSSLNPNTNNVNISQTMDEHLENLKEKDTKMRQATLHRINRLLRQVIECDDYLRAKSCDNLQTLSFLLRDSLYHGESEEQCLALQTISLLMISLHGNHNIVEKAVYSIIIKLTEQTDSISVQIQAIKTLACTVWTLNDVSKKSDVINHLHKIWKNNNTLDKTEIDEKDDLSYSAQYEASEDNDILDSLEESEELKTDDIDNDDESKVSSDISKDETEQLKITAIESWSWLIASIGSDVSIGSLLEDYSKELLDILENNNNVSLRCAAGEALTLLVWNYKQTENIQENNSNGNDNENKKKSINFDDIDAIFYELSETYDIKRKNELKQQRIKFRSYINGLDNGWQPIVKIKLRGKDYEKQGWDIWIIYNRLKNVLKEGFQLHLIKNELIQNVFDISNVEKVEQLTQVEKKSKLMIHADNAKQQKQHIKEQRQQKRAFMFEHGDEG